MAKDSQPPYRAPGRDRRGDADRRGSSRESAKASDRRGTPRRAYTRRPAPMGSGALQGELIDAAGGRWSFKVWDLGEGGVCVFTQGNIDNLDGTSLKLTIFDRFERLDHQMEARLAWQTQEGITFFLGLAFDTPIETGLFYERYLAPGKG
ncbi:MAG: hypothetical protein WD136_02190 [Cyanobium sp.]